jgi:hypothetical protein
MPTKPDVTSHANHHYQKRFDKLAELAAAGDWDAVAGYECNGVNSYAKMVRQYRDRLVAAHTAQEAATAGSGTVTDAVCRACGVSIAWTIAKHSGGSTVAEAASLP